MIKGIDGITEIKNIIQENRFNESAFKDFVKNKAFIDIINKFFIKQIDDKGNVIEFFWQMPGFCVFEYGQDYKLLIAQKRNTKYDKTFVVNNNPGKNKEINNIFNYSKNMHTERQLILSALYARFANNLQENNNPNNENIITGSLINRSLIMPNNINSVLDGKQLNGSMYVYVPDNPCQNVSKNNDNGGISCIDYYNELANLFKDIKFNVYFDADGMQLNPNFIDTNKQETTLLHFIKDKLFKNNHGTKTFTDIKYGTYTFTLDTNNNKLILEIRGNNGNSDNFEMSANEFIRNNDSGKNIKKLIATINKILVARNKGRQQITNKQKESLFNSIHNPNNIKNIYYHLI